MSNNKEKISLLCIYHIILLRSVEYSIQKLQLEKPGMVKAAFGTTPVSPPTLPRAAKGALVI